MTKISTHWALKTNYGGARLDSSIKYIVIHYTANDGDSAKGNGNYFAPGYRGASAHYFVDSSSIVQSVPDKNVAWSVGGNKYSDSNKTGGAKYYGKCTNNNSINIEICDDVKNGIIYPTEATIKNVVELAKMLMKKYNININNVIRHFDVTGKRCPAYWCGDTEKNAKWQSFKNRILEEEKPKEDDEMVEKITVNINGKDYKANRILKENKNYICLTDLKQAGFEIGYDKNTKVPSLANADKELKIKVNDKETTVESVNINGNNYVPIRSLAKATGAFDVDFKGNEVVVKTK